MFSEFPLLPALVGHVGAGKVQGVLERLFVAGEEAAPDRGGTSPECKHFNRLPSQENFGVVASSSRCSRPLPKHSLFIGEAR